MSVTSPLSTSAPRFARDTHELRSVLSAQTAEADALKEQLAYAQRECANLRQRLRDSEGELLVAADVTASATERLGSHAIRHGLVLSAGVQRCGVERSTLEDELQRMERLLYERDQEIAQLRRAAQELEACQFQGELELKGMVVAHEVSSSEARVLGAGVADLAQRLGEASGSSPSRRGPSQREVAQAVGVAQALAAKREEHQAIRARAEAAAAEARRLEADEGELVQLVALFEQGLRGRQQEMEAHDKRFVREEALLHEHCEELRRHLQHEQRDAVGLDQRAVLQPQCGVEAESVRREVNAMLQILPGLEAALRARGRSVHSLEVHRDAIDQSLHAYLRGCAANGSDPVPPLVCRLGPGEYFLGGEHVAISISPQRQLMVRDARGRPPVPLSDFLRGKTMQPPPLGKDGWPRAVGDGQLQRPCPSGAMYF